MIPTLTDILTQHRPYGLDCACGRPINSDGDWARHVAQVWREVRTISTVEQLDNPSLDALGTLIMEIHHPFDGCADSLCWVVPVVWEMVNQMGWVCHGRDFDDTVPHLPALLIEYPYWSES